MYYVYTLKSMEMVRAAFYGKSMEAVLQVHNTSYVDILPHAKCTDFLFPVAQLLDLWREASTSQNTTQWRE